MSVRGRERGGGAWRGRTGIGGGADGHGSLGDRRATTSRWGPGPHVGEGGVLGERDAGAWGRDGVKSMGGSSDRE